MDDILAEQLKGSHLIRKQMARVASNKEPHPYITRDINNARRAIFHTMKQQGLTEADVAANTPQRDIDARMQNVSHHLLRLQLSDVDTQLRELVSDPAKADERRCVWPRLKAYRDKLALELQNYDKKRYAAMRRPTGYFEDVDFILTPERKPRFGASGELGAPPRPQRPRTVGFLNMPVNRNSAAGNVGIASLRSPPGGGPDTPGGQRRQRPHAGAVARYTGRSGRIRRGYHVDDDVPPENEEEEDEEYEEEILEEIEEEIEEDEEDADDGGRTYIDVDAEPDYIDADEEEEDNATDTMYAPHTEPNSYYFDEDPTDPNEIRFTEGIAWAPADNGDSDYRAYDDDDDDGSTWYVRGPHNTWTARQQAWMAEVSDTYHLLDQLVDHILAYNRTLMRSAMMTRGETVDQTIAGQMEQQLRRLMALIPDIGVTEYRNAWDSITNTVGEAFLMLPEGVGHQWIRDAVDQLLMLMQIVVNLSEQIRIIFPQFRHNLREIWQDALAFHPTLLPPTSARTTTYLHIVRDNVESLLQGAGGRMRALRQEANRRSASRASISGRMGSPTQALMRPRDDMEIEGNVLRGFTQAARRRNPGDSGDIDSRWREAEVDLERRYFGQYQSRPRYTSAQNFLDELDGAPDPPPASRHFLDELDGAPDPPPASRQRARRLTDEERRAMLAGIRQRGTGALREFRQSARDAEDNRLRALAEVRRRREEERAQGQGRRFPPPRRGGGGGPGGGPAGQTV